MNPTIKKTSPFLLIITGLFLLFYMGMAEPAGVCLLMGIVMIVERVWPERWEADKQKIDK